jgi:DNA-binding PadR family transcriptional regulator
MRDAPPDPLEFLPLTVQVFHILLSLADRDGHGYGIMKEIDERTEGSVQLGPGTLYGSIKRLRRSGLIEEVQATARFSDRERRVYRLTPFGRRVAQEETLRLERLAAGARANLGYPVGASES